MKKYILVIFIITSYLGYSQGSISFINVDATWIVAKTYPNTNPQNPNFVETKTKIYGINGDTLIDQILWQKYYSTYDIDFQSDLSFEAYLREENGYVTILDANNSIDTLYNFNIQIGDSMGYDFGFGIDYLEVLNIDSLLIDEAYHKRFYFEEPFYPPSELTEIWIEGIGSIHGPLFPLYPKLFSSEIPDSMNLTCYKNGVSILWQNTNYETCYVNIVLALENPEKEVLKVYPNPATTQIAFELPVLYKVSLLQIKNIYGKTIIQIPLAKAQSQIQWDCSGISSGVYFYQTQINGEVYRGKIVVN
jgi:hypothetical protein